MNYAGVSLVMMLLVFCDLRFFVMSIHLAIVVRLLFTDDHFMFACIVSCESVRFLAFVLAHGARKPCGVAIMDLDCAGRQDVFANSLFLQTSSCIRCRSVFAHVVHIGKMCVQIRCCFKLLLAYVARAPLHVNVVLLGKMLFQIATTFAFVIADVAITPLNVDVVLVGKMFFQSATVLAFVLAHAA